MVTGTVEEGDDEAVRRVFNVSTMRTVLTRTDWRVQVQGGYLAGWTGEGVLGPIRRAKLVADAVGLRAALLAAHTGTTEEPAVPAPHNAVPSTRQAARLQASLLGGVLGAFSAFFLAGSLHLALFISRQAPAGGWGGAWLPTCILLGAALGATAGRLLPLRRPLLRQPAIRNPQQERVIGCGFLVGLVGGFLTGAVGGVVAGELLGLGFDDWALRALLFFGGMGLGTLAGPILLGMGTSRIYRWWTAPRE